MIDLNKKFSYFIRFFFYYNNFSSGFNKICFYYDKY